MVPARSPETGQNQGNLPHSAPQKCEVLTLLTQTKRANFNLNTLKFTLNGWGSWI